MPTMFDHNISYTDDYMDSKSPEGDRNNKQSVSGFDIFNQE